MTLLDPNAGMNYLKSQGWTPIAAAGILGNAYGESGFDPNITGDGGAAHGLFQTHTRWHPGYDRNFNAMQQLQFASNELKTRYPSLAAQMNSATNVAQSTELFMRGYEKPANYSSLGKRIAAAGNLLKDGKAMADSAVASVKKLLGGDAGNILTSAANIYLPGSGTIMSAMGIGGQSESWLDKLKNWIAESGFFQRLGLALLAFIVLAAGFYLIKSNVIEKGI